jgi:pheromone shutdown protein TraB
MAARLATLRAAGPVVAVVGLEHVAEIAATLGKRDD